MFKENIPGICIEDGLKYCGTPEAYEKFLKKLEDLLGRFDWEAMEELIKGVEI